MLFLVFQKKKKNDGREGVCLDPAPSVTPPVSDADLAVLFADKSTEDAEQDADCVHSAGRFSEYDGGEDWIQCTKYFGWAHRHCVLVWRSVVSLVEDKHCFVLSLYRLYL